MSEIELETLLPDDKSSSSPPGPTATTNYNGSNDDDNPSNVVVMGSSADVVCVENSYKIDDDTNGCIDDTNNNNNVIQANHFRKTTNRPELRWSESAIQRRKTYQDAQTAALRIEQELLLEIERTKNNRSKKKLSDRFQNGLLQVGTVLQKVNIAKWIDELEQDQEIADELERVNVDLQEENERKRIVREAQQACMDAIRNHLHSFLQDDNHNASYEDWISELHPENVILQPIPPPDGNSEGQPTSIKVLDARYYLIDSDHRIMWNDAITELELQQQQPAAAAESPNARSNDDMTKTMSSPPIPSNRSRIVEAKHMT